MDEASIEKLAEEELLQEAKRGAARASVDGPTGWQKCPLPRTNKRFLHNTILHSLQSNRGPRERRRDAEYRRPSGDGRRGRRDKEPRSGDRAQRSDRADAADSEKKADVIVPQGGSHDGDEPVK